MIVPRRARREQRTYSLGLSKEVINLTNIDEIRIDLGGKCSFVALDQWPESEGYI